MLQRLEGILPGRDEFLGHVVGETRLDDLPDDGRIVDLLASVYLTSPRVTRGMIVADVILVLPDSADDISLPSGMAVSMMLEEAGMVGKPSLSDDGFDPDLLG